MALNEPGSIGHICLLVNTARPNREDPHYYDYKRTTGPALFAYEHFLCYDLIRIWEELKDCEPLGLEFDEILSQRVNITREPDL